MATFDRSNPTGPTLASEPQAARPDLVGHDVRKVNRMETCNCRGAPTGEEIVLTLECLDCDGGVVTCPHCGKPEWWSNDKRRLALNAAEGHRWQTGHSRVVARGFGPGFEGQIVMEVGDE